jgi:hypothetical protein
MGCTCNSDRAPKKYGILVRMPLYDYLEGVVRDGRVTFRFMKQVRIWTKVGTVQYHFQWRVGGVSGVLLMGYEPYAGRLMIRRHGCQYSRVKIVLSFCIPWSHMGWWMYRCIHSSPRHEVEMCGDLHVPAAWCQERDRLPRGELASDRPGALQKREMAYRRGSNHGSLAQPSHCHDCFMVLRLDDCDSCCVHWTGTEAELQSLLNHRLWWN